MKLEGKIVAITGAASGIGAALSDAFAGAGAAVALLDVDAARLDAKATSMRAKGFEVSAHPSDVRDPAALERSRDQILSAHGGVDVLVNNAGVTTFGPFEQLSDEELRRVVDINMWGVMHGCRVFLPALRQRGRSHVVNVASEAGLQGMPWQSVYCATKFAVRGFTGSLRAELAADGIGVTCVLPGATATNILAAAGSTDPETTAQLSSLLLRHGPSPRRVARRVVGAVRRNKAEVFTGPDSWALDWGVRFAPGLVRWAMLRTAREARRREARRLPGEGAHHALDARDAGEAAAEPAAEVRSPGSGTSEASS